MHEQYIALAYYLFVSIENPHEEVEKHKLFFEEKKCTGRIYISEEGINGQMSGLFSDVQAYVAWMQHDARFAQICFKTHEVLEQIFPRMSVKYRSQLVALDHQLDVKEGGIHVSPAEWKKMLESGEYLVLDVRNQYESEIGHFEGAVLPPLQTFREFPQYAEQLKEKVDPKHTKVMMYCTGGIRCELYSALLKKKGFEEVYQLEGGVINYGFKEGKSHWKGKLFVFDDRLAIDIDGEKSLPISVCIHCQTAFDLYYNCANMDCNELFICCHSCLQVYRGCCSFSCKMAPRVRTLEVDQGNKPFRRKHLIVTSSQAPKCDLESEE